MMRTYFLTGACAMALLLAGCGGESAGPSIPLPGPTPSPTPTATPVPTATRFQAEAGGTLIAELRFQRTEVPETSPIGASAATTNRAGLFYAGITDPIAPSGATAAFVDDGQNSITAVGVDRLTGQRMILYAPRGATVVSPLTSLIAFTRDEARVKRALGLSDGPYRLLDPARALTRASFTADGAAMGETVLVDSRRLRAANIRTIAYLDALNQLHLGAGVDSTPAPQLDLSPDRLAAILRADQAARLDTAEGLTAAIRALPRWSANTGVYRDDVVAAAASLVRVYAEAIGTEVGSDADAARLLLGVQGYLRPALAELSRQNSQAAAARVAAITAADVRTAIAPFEPLPATTAGLLFPGPDFVPVTPGGELTLPLYHPDWPASLAMNDTVAFATYPAAPIAKESLTLVGVSVPARFAAALTVRVEAGSVTSIRLARGTTAITWFDYTYRTPSGLEATGRAFVLPPA